MLSKYSMNNCMPLPGLTPLGEQVKYASWRKQVFFGPGSVITWSHQVTPGHTLPKHLHFPNPEQYPRMFYSVVGPVEVRFCPAVVNSARAVCTASSQRSIKFLQMYLSITISLTEWAEIRDIMK